jgi:HAD superfamily hydrolase (TIGR01509 family)
MIKAIIFDMDGVIVDSEPLWEKGAKVYFQKIGKTFPTSRRFKQFINLHFRGRNQKYIVSVLKKKFGLRGSYIKILRDRLLILFKIFDKELKLIPGALPLIKKFHQHGYLLLLASSSPKEVISYMVKRYKLKRYFKKIISGDDFRHGKPNPEIFIKGAGLLGEKPRDILVIEDSISGVQAAHRAGAKCIALKQPYTANKYLKTADLVVKKLNQITIKKLKKI